MEVIRASVDRFEGEFAVVYSDEDDRRFDIPLQLLTGIKPGSRVLVSLENDSIQSVEEDKEATDDARDRIKRKYQKLRAGRHL
ncbi:MAG: DUF3006 domain-containing protein [Thermoproteota archaeon]